MKDVFRIGVSQTDRDFSKRCTDTAKDFGLSANVKYETMTFGFPLNTCHYRIAVEGEEDAIEKFKRFMGIGVESEDDNFIVPMIFGVIMIVVLVFVIIITNP